MANLVHLSQQGSLATVEIAVSSLTFLLGTFATVYKGYLDGDQTGARALLGAIPRGIVGAPGFLWVAVLSLTHIVGSACYINSELSSPDLLLADSDHQQVSTPNAAYATTSFIGAAPVLLAALSFSQFTGAATAGGLGKVVIVLLQLLPAAGFVLGIAGGVEYSHASAGDQTVGKDLLEASAILFVVTLAALVCITAINLSFVRSLRTLAITVSMPFLVVRIIYNLFTAFSDSDTIYAFDLPGLEVQIFTRFIMEYAVVMFYLFTGLGALVNPGHEQLEKSEESDGSIVKTEDRQMEEGRESEIASEPEIAPVPQAQGRSELSPI